jgi:ABC-type phosphate transport system substrate-binding protein
LSVRPRRLRVNRNLTAGAGVASIGAIAASVALAVPGTAAAAGTTTLIGSGSSAAQTYLQDLFAAYQKTSAGKHLKLKYNPDGGNAGVQDVQSGTSEFALQTAQPSTTSVTSDPLFLDAETIAVNKSNKLAKISEPEAADIFEGKISTWTSVTGSGLSSTIHPYGREPTAGLYTIFQKVVLNGATFGSDVTPESSDGLVATEVGSVGNAIGYVGLANSKKSGVKALSVSIKNGGTAYAPTAANVKKFGSSGGKSGYPLTHFDWVVLPNKSANPTVKAFFNWVKSSAAAASVINKAGAVSYFNK